MIPSETPPVRRVSSTTRTRCVATASRAMSSIGSGASQRRSTTRASIPRSSQPAGDAERQQEAVAPREDRQVAAVAVGASRAERDVPGAGGGEPEAVALLVEIARVVERDRLEERADAAVDLRRGDAGAQHRGGIVRPGGRGDHDAGDVAQDGDRVVVVEVPAEALLVAVPGDPHDHAVAVAPLREELQRRRLAAELVLGVVEVGEVLDLGQRQEAADRAPEGEAEDRRLVEQRVEDAAGAEPRMQPARDAVDAALRRHVLAEEERLGMRLQGVRQSAVDRERERERLGGGSLPASVALARARQSPPGSAARVGA